VVGRAGERAAAATAVETEGVAREAATVAETVAAKAAAKAVEREVVTAAETEVVREVVRAAAVRVAAREVVMEAAWEVVMEEAMEAATVAATAAAKAAAKAAARVEGLVVGGSVVGLVGGWVAVAMVEAVSEVTVVASISHRSLRSRSRSYSCRYRTGGLHRRRGHPRHSGTYLCTSIRLRPSRSRPSVNAFRMLAFQMLERLAAALVQDVTARAPLVAILPMIHYRIVPTPSQALQHIRAEMSSSIRGGLVNVLAGRVPDALRRDPASKLQPS